MCWKLWLNFLFLNKINFRNIFTILKMWLEIKFKSYKINDKEILLSAPSSELYVVVVRQCLWCDAKLWDKTMVRWVHRYVRQSWAVLGWRWWLISGMMGIFVGGASLLCPLLSLMSTSKIYLPHFLQQFISSYNVLTSNTKWSCLFLVLPIQELLCCVVEPKIFCWM